MKIAPGLTTEETLERISRTLATQELYYGHGTDNPEDEAGWLLDAVMTRLAPSPGEGKMLTTAQAELIEKLLARRIRERKPLAYLLGEAWFGGLQFYVDERVLVPRSPMAELIHNGFEPLLSRPPERILDLCAGSGCIGIACALAFPDARVDLSDISSGALEVAAVNVSKHGLDDRIRLIQSDGFEALRGLYDLIVCNPPYVSEEEYQTLPHEYLNEPAEGLLASEEGLALATRLIREAGGFLTEDGLLVMEVGNNWMALDERMPEMPFLWLDFEHGGHGVFALRARDLAPV